MPTVPTWEGNDGFQLGLVLAGHLGGAIGFHRVDWVNESTSLGSWIAERHQGQGLMTRAALALVDHAFDEWGLHRVEIRAAVDNLRSRRVHKRLGFVEEGVLREAERIGGRHLDVVLYSMLVADWRRRRGPEPGD